MQNLAEKPPASRKFREEGRQSTMSRIVSPLNSPRQQYSNSPIVHDTPPSSDASLSTYMCEITSIPLLSQQEEEAQVIFMLINVEYCC